MIVVHPLDEPLFRALFAGHINLGQFIEKRVELHSRHDAGEDLRTLLGEAKGYAEKWKTAGSRKNGWK